MNKYYSHYYAYSNSTKRWGKEAFVEIQSLSLPYSMKQRYVFFDGAGFKEEAAQKLMEVWNMRGNGYYRYSLEKPD